MSIVAPSLPAQLFKVECKIKRKKKDLKEDKIFRGQLRQGVEDQHTPLHTWRGEAMGAGFLEAFLLPAFLLLRDLALMSCCP